MIMPITTAVVSTELDYMPLTSKERDRNLYKHLSIRYVLQSLHSAVMEMLKKESRPWKN